MQVKLGQKSQLAIVSVASMYILHVVLVDFVKSACNLDQRDSTEKNELSNVRPVWNRF